MPLTKVLQNIKEQIDNKELKKNKNESDLKQDIWDILKELSWPNKNSKNEYKLSTGDRPDFALIHPDSQEPLVFIELKRHGLTRLKNSKEQVKGYYSNSTVPLIVLTDVETWMFYYKGKLAFETDFSSSSVRKVSGQLKEFLEQDRVYKGDAYRFAEGKLAEKNNLAKARKKIPAAWKEILEESNSSLNNLIKELQKKAGAGLGVQPSDGDIVAFLQSLESKNGSGNTRQPRPKSERRQTLTPSSVSPGRKAAATMAVKYPGILVRGNKKPQSKGLPHELLQAFFTGKNARRRLTYDEAVLIGIEGGHDANRVKWQLGHYLLKRDYIRFDEQAQGNGKREENRDITAPPRAGELVILGKSFPCKNPTDAMVTVFKELERRERGFWQRFYNDRRNHGRKHRIIAQDAGRLYDSDNPRYAKAYKQLGGDWVIATYNSKKTIEKNIRIAVEVARLRFGKDIITNFDDSFPGPARVKVVIDGKPSSWQDQSDAMATVFREFQKRDQNFYQRFYEQPRNHGKTRRIIAQDARRLYDHPGLKPGLKGKHYRPLSGGWFISTNYGWEGSKSSKKGIIQLAADVAGFNFKEDISEKGIIVNLDKKT